MTHDEWIKYREQQRETLERKALVHHLVAVLLPIREASRAAHGDMDTTMYQDDLVRDAIYAAMMKLGIDDAGACPLCLN